MTFNFYIGGYGRDSHRFTLDNSRLRCSEYYGIPSDHDKIISVAENEDWGKLLNFLKGCDWKRRYDSDILDGTQWELKVKAPRIHINSYGSNAYPENFGEFLVLLNRVLGETGLQVK
ncbi:hypothetical protein [uncultured Pontibacter sp.]|uniref:hypothetical protein n=1 Tax=uncultured Pontibacter sp. TaxID=453356 RepID=UPI00262AE7B0|nr:hypothetical protein [uncultured Pontibacter sp.]